MPLPQHLLAIFLLPFLLFNFNFLVNNVHANNALFLFICSIRVGNGNVLGAKYFPEIAQIKMRHSW